MPADPELLAAVAALRQEVARLADRVAALEGGAKAPAEEPVSDEVVLVIAAAVAAFLGVKARVRQVRLLQFTDRADVDLRPRSRATPLRPVHPVRAR